MRPPMRLLALLLLSLAAPALAQDDGGQPITPDASLFVMTLEGNPEAVQYAPTTTQTLAYRLAITKLNVLTATDIAAALGRERQAQLLGCTETGCMAELGQAMGARYEFTEQRTGGINFGLSLGITYRF